MTGVSAVITHGGPGDVRSGCEVGAGSRHLWWQDKRSFELEFDLNRHKAAPLVRPSLLGSSYFAGLAAESRPTMVTARAAAFGASGPVKLRGKCG